MRSSFHRRIGMRCQGDALRGSSSMFEQISILGPTERSIVVQTRRGRDIPNSVEVEPDYAARRKYRLLWDKFGRNWKERKPATGTCNCAGHVWANRRTAIFALEGWRLILNDDGYRRLLDSEEPSPGDLVLYLDRQDSGFLHVGEILELREWSAGRIPWVLSKWNSTSGEVMHYVDDVPFHAQFDVRREYWTERPAP